MKYEKNKENLKSFLYTYIYNVYIYIYIYTYIYIFIYLIYKVFIAPTYMSKFFMYIYIYIISVNNIRQYNGHHFAVFKSFSLYRLKFPYLLRDLRVLIGPYFKFS